MQTNTLPASVSELLTLHDELFVESAYLFLLGRVADPFGRDYYLNRIRDGGSRHRIVAELALSDEGMSRPARATGLHEHLQAHRTRNRWHRLMSRLWKDDPFGDSARERRNRRASKEGVRGGGGHAGAATAVADSPAVEEIFEKLRNAVKG